MTTDTLQWGMDKLAHTYGHGVYGIQHDPPCPCARRSELYFSFLQGRQTQRCTDQDGAIKEECGWYCAQCGFSNAGARVVRE